MYKRKSKPDLLFTLTVFVCLSVLVSTIVTADEPQDKGWGLTLSAESGCAAAIGEWQGCSKWQGNAAGVQPRRAALRLSTEDRPDLGVVWYYTQTDQASYLQDFESSSDFGTLPNSFGDYYKGQFGVAVKRQYGQFGFSVGLEAERPTALTDEPLLYFGVSNRW